MQHKLLLALLVINLALITSAQKRFALKAGFTTSTVRVIEGNSAATYTSKSGIQFGLTGNVPVSNDFDLMTGLLYTQKGYTEEYGKPGALGHSLFDRRINYLELPVDLVWKMTKNTRSLFFIATGIVPAVGLSDKMKYSLDYSGRLPDAGTTHAGFGDSKYYKLFSLGWNVISGVELKKLALSLDYNTGLTPVNNTGYGLPLLKSRTLSITLGYFLTKRGSLGKQHL